MENTIKNQIIAFYDDALYQKLYAYYGKTTLFNILKVERNEKRHSAFLAWLLNVKESHGLGEEPFRRFMRLLSKQDDKYNNPFLYGNYQIANMEVETEKNANKGFVDIDIEFGYKINKIDKPTLVHIILENKIYTKEQNEQTELYYNWAKEERDEKQNKSIIGVYLSPELVEKCAGDFVDDDFKYIKITYGDILKYVIEPLLIKEMPNETRMILTDYVINLCQPWKVKNDDGKKASTDKDTILAVSRESKESFTKLYGKIKDLLDSALFATCYEEKTKKLKKEKELKIVYQSDFERIKSNTENDIELFKSFWTANEMLFTMVFDTVFEENNTCEDEETSAQYREAVSVLLNLKSSNRNTSKYLVYAKNGDLMNKNWKPTPFMSVASYYIFKAWLLEHPTASLKELREAFPVDECAQHYCGTYQFLFYRKDDIEKAIKFNANDEHDYVIAPMDEDNLNTKDKHKYLKWDFFVGKNAEQYFLSLSGDDIVLSVKMWHKDEFVELAEFAKDKYGIEVVEQ